METEEIVTRGRETEKVGIVGIIGNIFLFVIKIIVSIISKSQSMLADSINSGTDILSSLMTYIGGKISGSAPDDDHNYGHGKAEYVFSLIISLVMAYLAAKIAIDGIVSLVNKNKFTFSIWLVIVCVVTMTTKLVLYIYTNKIGKRQENILILANAQDHKNDVLVTASVLIGVIASKFGIYWLDGVVAVGIAIRILYVAIEFFTQSYSVLIDRSIDEQSLNTIKKIIKKYDNIDHIDKITSKATGKAFIIVIKVSVDGNMTVNESHQIAGKLKSEVMELKDVYDVVVHINPV